jgi:hypothetical protein
VGTDDEVDEGGEGQIPRRVLRKKRRAFWKRRRFWIAAISIVVAIILVLWIISSLGSRRGDMD